jgi:hypothetical protein
MLIFRDEYLAYKSALFFCINPASVLFMAPLSFTVLAASSFAAMITIENGKNFFYPLLCCCCCFCSCCSCFCCGDIKQPCMPFLKWSSCDLCIEAELDTFSSYQNHQIPMPIAKWLWLFLSDFCNLCFAIDPIFDGLWLYSCTCVV